MIQEYSRWMLDCKMMITKKYLRSKSQEIRIFLLLWEMLLRLLLNVDLNSTTNSMIVTMNGFWWSTTSQNSLKSSQKNLICNHFFIKDFPWKLFSRWCGRRIKCISWKIVHLQTWKTNGKSCIFERIKTGKDLS